MNGEHVYLKGVNEHHDFGALGAAFNRSAAERKLAGLRELGANAIRMSHNPPAPELLALTDSLGFLVMDEAFDVWERQKTPFDFHLVFPEWHEQDLVFARFLASIRTFTPPFRTSSFSAAKSRRH